MFTLVNQIELQNKISNFNRKLCYICCLLHESYHHIELRQQLVEIKKKLCWKFRVTQLIDTHKTGTTPRFIQNCQIVVPSLRKNKN